VECKIPILGDIPILGWYLFRKTDTVATDVELMVFLQPHVTGSWEDVERMMEEENKKTRLIREWEGKLEAEREEKEREEE
jgi:type II secretory pathway component GspD/PulD (secretin)